MYQINTFYFVSFKTQRTGVVKTGNLPPRKISVFPYETVTLDLRNILILKSDRFEVLSFPAAPINILWTYTSMSIITPSSLLPTVSCRFGPPSWIIYHSKAPEQCYKIMKKNWRKNTGHLKNSGGYYSPVIIWSDFHWYLIDFDQKKQYFDKN